MRPSLGRSGLVAAADMVAVAAATVVAATVVAVATAAAVAAVAAVVDTTADTRLAHIGAAIRGRVLDDPGRSRLAIVLWPGRSNAGGGSAA